MPLAEETLKLEKIGCCGLSLRIRNSSLCARARRRLISSSSVVRQLCKTGTWNCGKAVFGMHTDHSHLLSRVKAELFQVVHLMLTNLQKEKRPMTDAKEVGVGNPAEEKTFCHRTSEDYPRLRWASSFFKRKQIYFKDEPPRVVF